MRTCARRARARHSNFAGRPFHPATPPARSRGHAAAARVESGGSVWRRVCLVAR